MSNGVIYILTNPAFPDYVKIGYADNINSRLKQLNQSECIPFAFSMCEIPIGAKLDFWLSAWQPTDYVCTVADDRHVDYEGEKYTLTGLAKKLSNTNRSINGVTYFKYNGRWLGDLRREHEN